MEPVFDLLLLHLLSLVLKAVDFILDFLFGRTVTKGSRQERAEAGWPFAEDPEPSRLVTVLRQATYVREFPGNGINAKQVSKFRYFRLFNFFFISKFSIKQKVKKIRIKAGKFRSRQKIFFKALFVQIYRHSRYLPSASSSILEDDAVCLSHFTRDHAAFAVPKLGSDFFDLRRHPFHCIAVYHGAGAYILVPIDTFRFFAIFFLHYFFLKKVLCETGGWRRRSALAPRSTCA